MDREKVVSTLEEIKTQTAEIGLDSAVIAHEFIDKILSLLKEQDSLLGIQQTADAITFLSTGTAQQSEERGILLGKSLMHEWIYKELLRKGLLTDDIRSVFEQAKRV